MEACEVVRLFVNKVVVPTEPKRRGNPGYGRVKALRVLVYSRLKGLENDTRVVEHFKKHAWTLKALGLRCVPDRTTIGRWWKRYFGVLEQVFRGIADMVQLLAPTTHLIPDSTPLERPLRPRSQMGLHSRRTLQRLQTPLCSQPVRAAFESQGHAW